MAKNPNIPPSQVPLLNRDGTLATAWYRYFSDLEKRTDGAAAGEVVAGPGLSGGGTVSNGVTLSLADNGTTDAKLRQSVGTSVIGRFAGSTGNVADIRATADNRVLARQGGILVFTANPHVEDLRCDTLRIDTAPTVSAATPSTHKVQVNLNGTTFYLLATT